MKLAEPLKKYQETYMSLAESTREKINLWKARASECKTVDEWTFNKTQDPEFLDRGREAYVFKLHDANLDQDLAIKIYCPKFSKNTISELKAMHKTKTASIPKVAELKAVNNGVIVQNYVQGKRLDSLSNEEITQITEDQILELLETIDALISIGVSVDMEACNSIYSPEYGFSVIDIKNNSNPKLEQDQQERRREVVDEIDAVIRRYSILADYSLTKPSNSQNLKDKYKKACEKFLAE